MTWHHHHDGDDRILFCRADGTECIEEYDGLVCDGLVRDEATLTWGPCKWHLAYGEYVVDVGEQLTLVTDLEVAGGVKEVFRADA